MAYRYTHTRPVDFYETDMAGIAHFSNFFRWMEATEAAFFASLGGSLVEPLEGGEAIRGWPRVRVHCEYHAPVRFGDTLSIDLFVKELKVRAIEYAFYFYTGKDGAFTHVATGGMTTVCIHRETRFDAPLQSHAIPAHLLAVLENAPQGAIRSRRSETPPATGR